MLIGLLLVLFSLLLPQSAKAQEYFFQEEFDQTRIDNTLDSTKWNFFPNNQGSFVTIKEMGGVSILNQQNSTNKYPYAVTQNQSLPPSDYSAEIKFQYTKITPWGAGIILSDIQPPNGSDQFQNLININVWQDSSIGPALRIGFDGAEVFSTPITTAPHILKVDRIGQRYLIYFDNVLIYTSNETNEVVKYIFIGNPGIVPFLVPQWTTYNIDYIRVTQTAPEPFLDLPWDYTSDSLTFNDAALRITSFFDHEYPLLSSSLNEPTPASNTVIRLNQALQSDEPYSSHDGYDYGKRAKVNVNESVLAAADGEATYMNSCSACGNAILIDHKNGFLTRYYHLKKDGLITQTPGQKINVQKGQQIGKVGGTGNVAPAGDAGAHIHFMVVQDKDKDGNFENNLPDGIIDPFGWQSNSPDPWENYSFFYNGKQRTGSKSFYLFTKQLDNLNTTLTSNGGVFNSGRFKIEFPTGTTNQNLNLTLKQQPNPQTPSLRSIGAILFAETKDALGNEISQYQALFTLTVEAFVEDLQKLKQGTVSIFSSQDGQTWTKEPTTQNGNQFSTQINHMTYFALMGEPIDTTPPVTTAILEGEKGEEGFYRSEVKFTLDATDENGLGVDYTFYKLANQDWEQYTEPLNFTSEGKYKIEFYSADNDENLEEVKSAEFTVDKTLPEAKIVIDTTKLDLIISGLDSNPTTIIKTSKKNDEALYEIKDQSGNTLKLEVKDIDKKDFDQFKLYSTQYNNSPKTPQPNNTFNINYVVQSTKPDPLRISIQNLDIKNLIKIHVNYDSAKNQSSVITTEYQKKPVQNTISGPVFLQLKTNKGKLEYSY